MNAVVFTLICVTGLIVGLSAGGYEGGVVVAGLFGFLGLVGGAITEII